MRTTFLLLKGVTTIIYVITLYKMPEDDINIIIRTYTGHPCANVRGPYTKSSLPTASSLFNPKQAIKTVFPTPFNALLKR